MPMCQLLLLGTVPNRSVPETYSLRNSNRSVMCAAQGPGKNLGVPGLRVLQGPPQRRPLAQTVPDFEIGELSHVSLLNLRRLLEGTVTDFTLSRMFLHLYPL